MASVWQCTCRACGTPFTTPTRRGSPPWYCPPCRATKHRSRKGRARTTTEAGYGYQHQQVREAWAPEVAKGVVQCWRCGRYIHPLAEWDLGHDDWDRTVYRGPEHRACNRGAAARKKNGTLQRRINSRQW